MDIIISSPHPSVILSDYNAPYIDYFRSAIAIRWLSYHVESIRAAYFLDERTK